MVKIIFNKLISAVNIFSKISFSQNGEDIILRNFISKKNGFYIDVGANHPFRFSNTYYFYLLGWKGINIEPNPEMIKKLNKYRKRDINIETGINDKKSSLTYYYFNDPALNTFSKDRANSLIKEATYKNIGEKKIRVNTLKNVLDQYLPKNQEVDFISIDVESFDLNVLKSNDWQKYSPKFVLVEELEGTRDVENYLKKLNYLKVAQIFKTILFKKIT